MSLSGAAVLENSVDLGVAFYTDVDRRGWWITEETLLTEIRSLCLYQLLYLKNIQVGLHY